METTLRTNTKYEILTPGGWSDFEGVAKRYREDILQIETAGGKIIKCTTNHKISTPLGIKLAEHLCEGDEVDTKTGVDSIISINPSVPADVYDPVNVDINSLYYSNDIVSHNCNRYLGSSGTLIAGWKLQQMINDINHEPISADSKAGMRLFSPPQENHKYVIVADVSRGKGLDYSAFHVINITKMPYTAAFTFRNNEVSPSELSELINRFGRKYNYASVLVEINDIGESVGQMLFDDYEYENILFTKSNGTRGKTITQAWGKGIDMGVRTTITVKSVGCSVLKLLIEQDQLLVPDESTVMELCTFSRKGKSYEAEEGHNDDTVACLFLFAWLTTQPYFKQLSDINTMYDLRQETSEQMEDRVDHFGWNHTKNGGVAPDYDPGSFMSEDIYRDYEHIEEFGRMSTQGIINSPDVDDELSAFRKELLE